MIGKRLSPILEEIETTLLEFEVNRGEKPEYTIEGFRAATKIFMSAVMDKMWDVQERENMSIDDRVQMAEKAGNEIRKLIKVYTDIDTHSLYETVDLSKGGSSETGNLS